jgi:1,5-anhydro-D-fructose reductase (1,5-anhydro-D-mannitol-forming)
LAQLYAASKDQWQALQITPHSLGWGLLGASHVAEQFAIKAIRQQPILTDGRPGVNAWVVAVFSHNERRARDFANQNQLPHAYVNLSDLLARRDIHAVYVSSHPRHHYPLVMAALHAGKHVLCETPLALSLAEARLLVLTAADRGLLLGVNFSARGHPVVQQLRVLVDNAEIGDILGVRISNARLLPAQQQSWRLQANGGGVLFDRTIHDIDLLHYLLRDEISLVYATSTQQILREPNQQQVEEDLFVQGEMRCGQVSFQLHDSFILGHYPPSIEIYGTRGALIAHRPHLSPAQGVIFLRRHESSQEIPTPAIEPFWQSIYHFNAALRSESAPLATGVEGIQSLNVILALQRSLREKSPIRVLYPES